MPQYLETQSGRRIAYHQSHGAQPGLVFLGGFKSEFLRFDYSGHGESSEAFADGCIGDWAQDAQNAITQLTEGPQILVGSSMGGDFTEDSMWGGFTDAQKAELEAGQVALPSEYGEPYIITKKLIEDGRNHLVLRDPLPLPFPVRMMQGTDDVDVDMSVALRLIAHATGDDMRLIVLKNGDHRFSDEVALKLIEDAIRNVIEVTG